MIDLNKCPKTHKCKKYIERTCPILNSGVEQFCIKLFKINSLQDNALLTDRQKQHIKLVLDEDGSDREAYTRLKEIETNIESFISNGNNLYIYSATTGNGKSSFATRMLNAHIDNIWYKAELVCKCLFISCPKLLISLKENISKVNEYAEYIKENVQNADLVVWDDVATKGFTTFEMENMLNMIENRNLANKSNIYTSNLIGEELREAIGDRLYSRILNNSEIITLVGADKRGVIVD